MQQVVNQVRDTPSVVEPIVNILGAYICVMLIGQLKDIAFPFKYTSNLKHTYYFEINHPQRVKLDFCFKKELSKILNDATTELYHQCLLLISS